MSTPQLATHKKCTGCLACQDACKHGAISIRKDSNGFVYPSVDESKCRGCGLCSRICPINNVDKIGFRAPAKCYAAKVKDESLTKGCTSGGIATGLSMQTIQRGGVVYGASFVPRQGVLHIRVDDESQLQLLKGSKYVESRISSEIYKQIRIDIKSGKEVLFIGTPCQVAAVERIFGKDKLKTVSFICGGIPSQDYLFNHLRSYGLRKDEITNIIFRKGRQYCIEAWKGENVAFYQEQKDNVYLKAFDEKGYIVRPSCLRCEFCREERVGTLTVGDFWGVEETNCKIKYESNLSCVITHDEQGANTIESVLHVLVDEVPFEDIEKYNICLHSSRKCIGWEFLESLIHRLYPIFGFNRGIKIVNIAGKLYRAPVTLKSKISKYLK